MRRFVEEVIETTDDSVAGVIPISIREDERDAVFLLSFIQHILTDFVSGFIACLVI